MEKKKYKFPKTPGKIADLRYELNKEVSAAQKVADALKAKRTALDEYIINTLPKSNASGVSGKVGKIKVVSKVIPTVKDYTKFYGFIQKTKRFDLLQRRPNTGPIQELWDEGKKVPGVDKFTKISVSCGKA